MKQETFDLPYVVEDLDPSNNQKGLNFGSFKVRFSSCPYDKGLTMTYDKFNGEVLHIVDADKASRVYTLQLKTNNPNARLDNKFLLPGTRYFQI